MITVCHITSYYLGSNLYKKLIDQLNNINIKNKVYCFVNKNYILTKQIDERVFCDKTFNSIDRFNFITKHKKTFKSFRNFIDKNDKFDLLHAHSLFSNGYVAYMAHKKYNIPYIVAVRNTDMNVFFKYIFFLRPLGNKILVNASKVIFISKPYQQKCISKYVGKNAQEDICRKSLVIPNGIDEMFLNNRKFHDIQNNTINILYVGQISKNKNLIATIRACEVLISENYNIKYTVIGEILDKEYAKCLEKDFITYIPQVEQKELLDFYSKNDIFVMPSITETFGLVYAEAMSQGLPVIYTRGQGFDEFFEEGVVGYSVDCHNYNEIAQKIISIAKNYSSLSQNCYQLCIKFDWETIGNQYQEIYKELSE